MPIGSNGGGQLNVWVFEVGCVTTSPVGIEVVSTISVHPMVVAPTTVQYSDSSRSAVSETTGGSVRTVAGRALRTVAAQGSFGVESRGFGPYIGNGDMRFQRFYKEVVRMSDALTAEDIQNAVDILNGTPFISLLVKPFIEGSSVVFVNFYDFLNDIAFQCQIQQFGWVNGHRNGGASGNRPYTLTVKEVGPVKSGGLGNAAIAALMTVMTTWDDINDVVSSYTIDAIVDAQVAVAAVFMSELADSVEAVAAQIQGVQALMNGGSPTDPGFGGFFASCVRLEQAGNDIVAAVGQSSGDELDNSAGRIDAASTAGEGGNATLDRDEQLAEIQRLIDAAGFYQSLGAYYGMGRDAYQAFVEGAGTAGAPGPNIASTVRYVVTDTDTPSSIEARYGVSWAEILAANDLTPDEALYPGTELLVPATRTRGPQGIRGLPTFGSHLGEEAWGRDLPLELTAEDGDLVLVSGEDVLVQGVEWIVEQFGPEMMSASSVIPDAARPAYIRRRLEALVKQDGRFVAAELAVEIDAEGAIQVNGTVHAINGGTLTLGGSS